MWNIRYLGKLITTIPKPELRPFWGGFPYNQHHFGGIPSGIWSKFARSYPIENPNRAMPGISWTRSMLWIKNGRFQASLSYQVSYWLFTIHMEKRNRMLNWSNDVKGCCIKTDLNLSGCSVPSVLNSWIDLDFYLNNLSQKRWEPSQWPEFVGHFCCWFVLCWVWVLLDSENGTWNRKKSNSRVHTNVVHQCPPVSSASFQAVDAAKWDIHSIGPPGGQARTWKVMVSSNWSPFLMLRSS